LSGVPFPPELRLEPVRRDHRRQAFRSGEEPVDSWLARRALQHQQKHLSATKVLVHEQDNRIAGFYTLAMGQVDFGDLPVDVVKHLPRRNLPVAVLAWLGVDVRSQGLGLGTRLFAQALRDCYEAGKTFAFVAVILDCLNDRAKSFYRKWDFEELPGHPYRLFLSAAQLAALMEAK